MCNPPPPPPWAKVPSAVLFHAKRCSKCFGSDSSAPSLPPTSWDKSDQICFWKLKSLNFIFWKSESKPSACLMSQAAQPWALARPCPPLPFTVTDGAPSVQEAAAHRPVSSQWVLAFDVPVAVWPAPVHQSDWVSHPWQSGVWGDTRTHM